MDREWDEGGKIITHSADWIRNHWTAPGFDIIELRESGFAVPEERSRGHGVVLMRKRRPENATDA